MNEYSFLMFLLCNRQNTTKKKQIEIKNRWNKKREKKLIDYLFWFDEREASMYVRWREDDYNNDDDDGSL